MLEEQGIKHIFEKQN
jgi:hypothetical protein